MRRAVLAFLVSSAVTVWAQTCLVCGEIRSIREVHDRGGQAGARTTPGSPSGLDTGPVVGSVAQFSFGAGGGWRFGAAGTPEMQARFGETSYEITVAMDDGERRTVQRRDVSGFHVGQRVALRSGQLEPM
jgi:hypothetical protein